MNPIMQKSKQEQERYERMLKMNFDKEESTFDRATISKKLNSDSDKSLKEENQSITCELRATSFKNKIQDFFDQIKENAFVAALLSGLLIVLFTLFINQLIQIGEMKAQLKSIISDIQKIEEKYDEIQDGSIAEFRKDIANIKSRIQYVYDPYFDNSQTKYSSNLISDIKKLDSNINLVVTIGPEIVDCIGTFPQKCLIVNGELFYDSIEGFNHESGYIYELEIKRIKRCNPKILSDCLQDIGIYQYSLVKEISKKAIN